MTTQLPPTSVWHSGKLSNRWALLILDEIERGRRAERASPSQFHRRIKQCQQSSIALYQKIGRCLIEG